MRVVCKIGDFGRKEQVLRMVFLLAWWPNERNGHLDEFLNLAVSGSIGGCRE